MYAVVTPSDARALHHAIVSRLIHEAGWVMVAAQRGTTSFPEWPLPNEEPPDPAANVVRVYLRSPAAVAAGGTDLINLYYHQPNNELIVWLARTGGGTGVTWDVTEEEPVFDASLGDTVLDNAELAGAPAYLWASSSAFALFATEGGKGLWCGYMRSAVVTQDTPVPALGQGPDPFPAALVELEEVDTAFDAIRSFAFDAEGNVDLNAQVTTLWGSPTESILRKPIPWGSAVPVQPVVQAAVQMGDPSAPDMFLRGTCPGLYLTSSANAGSLLRVYSTGEDFLVAGGHWAFGPL